MTSPEHMASQSTNNSSVYWTACSVQQQEFINVLHYLRFVRRINRCQVVSPPKEPAVLKACALYGIIMETITWWRHQMETFSALLTLCAGNSPFYRRIPLTKASDAELWFFFMFSLIYVWTNSWVNNRDTGDLRCHRAHYDVIVMYE